MRLPVLLLLLAGLLAACGPAPRAAFTPEQQRAAVISGIPDARAWGDGTLAELAPLGLLPRDVAARREGDLDFLALSSGGPAGAYGAGVLVGWTEAGTRPDFDMVSGVSAGALIAPFAFVGPEGDAALRALWAEGAAGALGRGLNPVGLVSGRGLVDRAPLEALIDAYVDDALVARIADGHREGRRLLVVTLNLDAQRPVIWNLGAVAASGRPGAADLLRDVLLASASVPVAFAPVLIEAASGIVAIEEMHVDGGTSVQVPAFPDAAFLDSAAFAVPDGRDARLWLLVHYILEPEFGVTPPGGFGVGQRAYGSLIKGDVRSELFAIVDTAREAGMEPRIASIRQAVAWSPTDPFAPEFLRAMFQIGRGEALAGTAFAGG